MDHDAISPDITPLGNASPTDPALSMDVEGAAKPFYG
jgi:hypothetical protein